jgi:site-specific DNA-methyltransferase (adenine-specific)
MKFRNTIQHGDCIKGLQKLRNGSVDLVFADPPFNIGYKYDVYEDRQEDAKYLAWSRQWMSEVHRVLKRDGTFWLAIGDEYAAELKVAATREIGFHCRSWVIWYYTFGVHCRYKFTRSHAHLFHFVKDPKNFTFNAAEVKVPSARQLVYADKRAEATGRVPDDTWIMCPPGITPETWVLRPQDLPDGFTADSDTWYFSRVAGTFKERAGFHGCQMPEQLLGRIIRVSSHPGELVLDPFGGSGSTLVVAKKLGRDFAGFELSADYVAKIKERLKATKVGEPLSGPADPLRSAPPTPAQPSGRRVQNPKRRDLPQSRTQRRLFADEDAA